MDHVDGDWTNNKRDGSNYQTLCHPCHVEKTRQERQERTHRKRMADSETAGLLKAAGIELDEDDW